MKKATVTIAFDDEKLGALEFSLRKEHSSVQEHLEDALNALYEKTVPEPLREYLDSKAVPAPKPKRTAKSAAPKTPNSEPKPAAAVNQNRVALPRQLFGARAADAAGCAGDERDFFLHMQNLRGFPYCLSA